MQKPVQFELEVNEGKVSKEDGSFFVARPFSVFVGNDVVNVRFKRNAHHQVVYVLTQNEKTIGEFEFPDYAPQTEPTSLDGTMSAVSAAFVKLGIARSKTYKEAFDPESTTLSYKVVQVNAPAGASDPNPW